MFVEGPISNQESRPIGTALVDGSASMWRLKEYDYVEEEYFISGTASVYGPTSFDPVAPGEHWFLERDPLSTVHQRDVPYTTRAIVVRPRDPLAFSGIVHAVPFHVLSPVVRVEYDLLRRGHAWIGVEVNDGARYGTEAMWCGGVAHLRRHDLERYGRLSVSGGDPEAWGLPDEVISKAWENMSIHGHTPEHDVLAKEMYRTLTQGPDILLDVAEGLKLGGDKSLLPGFDVRRVYTTGASGSSLIPNSLVNDGHHNRNMLPDGRPPFDGYFIFVGLKPKTAGRPDGAVLAGFQSENEVVLWSGLNAVEDPPPNTDDPRFRFYEVAGTGHVYSALREGDALLRRVRGILPPSGIFSKKVTAEESGYEYSDKFNAPFVWALWDGMYRWVEDGLPMPATPPIVRDPDTADGLARDEHGNALGGLRTPWLDVPEATYVAQISAQDMNFAGMKRFSPEKMKALYGNREEYERRVAAKLDEMIEQRLLLPEDRDRAFDENVVATRSGAAASDGAVG